MRSRAVPYLRFAVLAILAALMLVPIAWALAASLRPPEVPFASGSVFFGGSLSLANYEKAFSLAPFARYYANTIFQVVAIRCAGDHRQSCRVRVRPLPVCR